MNDVNLHTDDQGSFQLLIDPVYGPNSKYFWPGKYWQASCYVLTPVRISPYVSGKDFLEIYAESFSGVEDYLESTDYPDRSYCDTLYNHFYHLYKDVESWERTTLFVSAVYRDLFHKMFPYESQILELRTDLYYESIIEPYLKEGKSEEEALMAAYSKTEARMAAYSESFKGVKKGEGSLSLDTCRGLISLLWSSDTDISLILELIKVLQRTNIVVNYQKQLQEGFLSTLELTGALALLVDETRRDLCREKLVLGLSLLQIEPKAAEKAVDNSLSLENYGPIISLIRDHPSKSGFVSNEASCFSKAYYIAPSYTATDYIRDLALSEEAYDRIFEEVRDSAAELRVTSVLMSFEEEGTKLAELAFSKMIRELFQENTDLLSLVAPVAKSLDENDLLFSEERPLKKIFDKIGERIDVPFEARERILEICKKHGIPDNADLAEKILSVASLTQGKGNNSALEKLVRAFASLLALAVASVVPLRSNVVVVGPIYPRIGMSTNQVNETRVYVSERPSKVASQSSVQFNLTQRQRNRVLRQSTVISAEKKGFTLLTTKEDKKRFDDIYIHGTFDDARKEITMEGSVGPAHRLEELRKGPVSKVARNLGYTALKVDLDHHLSSRVRQGLYHFTERQYDLSITEAISPSIHSLITTEGENTYRLPKGIVSIDDYLNQILTKRVKVFKSDAAQAIMKKEGRFTSEDYTAWSERGSTWNRKFLRYIAAQQGVNDKCVKSLLYPKQIYDDADGYIKRMHLHLRRTPSSNIAPSDLEETQALLTETIEKVSLRVSLLAKFRDSSQSSLGLAQDVRRLVIACNDLSDLANSRYRLSRLTGSPLSIPPLGRIVSLDETIVDADEAGYTQQWALYGAKSETNKSSKEGLKRCNHLVLTTNGLVEEPIRTSMKELMNAPLVGQKYNGVDEGFLN